MKHASFVRRCLAGIAVSVFLSSCSGKQSGVFSGGQPDPPAERQAAEILKTEKIPELIAEELSGNDESSEYRTEEGETVLFVAGSPERDKDGPGTGPIDFLRISRTCDLWILSYHVDSVRIGQSKKGKNGEWTCAVSAGLSGRIIRLEQVNGCILEKGFPVNWEDLPEARKGSFLEERDGFHEKRFDLCFLYSRAKDLPAVSESRRVRCFFVYSPADSEWHLKDRKEASVAKTIPSLGSVLADCFRENLISFYEQKGMTPSQNGNDLVFQDKAAAEYHARRDKGEIFDESIGKWVDHEEKKQNDTLIRQYEKYRKKKITLPEMIHTLDACKKAAVRGLILRDLNDKILQRIDFLNIPSEKNRRRSETFSVFVR